MYKFGKKSQKKMEGIDKNLKIILHSAIESVDFSVIEGHRGEKKQNRYFKEGKSKKKFPNGKHNSLPSEAVDIAPHPYPKGSEVPVQAYFLAGIIIGIAKELGIKIRIGCDWNGDGDIRNDKFQDVWHMELL